MRLVADRDGLRRNPTPESIVVDGGAGWLQEWDVNPLARLAESIELDIVATDFTRPVERPTLAALQRANSYDPFDLLVDRIRAVTEQGDMSLADAVSGWIEHLSDQDRSAVQRVLDAGIDPESGAPHDDLSALGAVGEPGVGLGDRLIVGGYRTLLDHLMLGLGRPPMVANGPRRLFPLVR